MKKSRTVLTRQVPFTAYNDVFCNIPFWRLEIQVKKTFWLFSWWSTQTILIQSTDLNKIVSYVKGKNIKLDNLCQ